MTERKKQSRMVQALLETAEDLRAGGLMTATEFEKITIRHLGIKKEKSETVPPLTGLEIKELRQKAHMSQAAFAHCLNLTTGYVSQLEREVRRRTGAVLLLLNVIRRKGIEAIL